MTPELAEQWLALNFDKNRKKKKTIIERLVEALRSGRFYITHQGIAFDQYGYLVDGQNRLNAILRTGVGAWLLVSYGVPRENLIGVDMGIQRSDSDQMHMAGLEAGERRVAIGRSMYLIGSGRVADYTMKGWKLQDFVIAHSDAINFALQAYPPARGLPASVRAVIALAYYHVDREQLARFAHAVGTGAVASDCESAAGLLFRHLAKHGSHGSRSAYIAAMKTVSALNAFLEKRPITKLYDASEIPWVLPHS